MDNNGNEKHEELLREIKNIKNFKWSPLTMPICIGVILYVALTHLGAIGKVLSGFGGYFAAVLLGCVLAYMLNPLAMLFQRTIFKKLKRSSWSLSVALSFITLLAFITLLLGTLIPQMVTSISSLLTNVDTYVNSLEAAIEKIIGSSGMIDSERVISVLESMADRVKNYFHEHSAEIISKSAGVLKGALNWVIALILSVYLLAAKSSILAWIKRLFQAALPEHQYNSAGEFLKRCDSILIKYIIYSFIECMIVGVVNAIFMKIAGMPYIGLISLVVALTNLIPTFGPIIGALIGAFILLMAAPWKALIFLIFTVLLQFVDGYIVKPRLFGNTLGVSGLLILISVVVMGNMFGIIGILLAIPTAAILDFLYDEALLPMLERRKKKNNDPWMLE